VVRHLHLMLMLLLVVVLAGDRQDKVAARAGAFLQVVEALFLVVQNCQEAGSHSLAVVAVVPFAWLLPQPGL